MSVKAWLNWETLFLVMFPVVAKLAGNKQNVLLPRWLNEETLFPKTNELRILTSEGVWGKMFTFSRPQGYTQCMKMY